MAQVRTIALVDNTSIAGAGRTLYRNADAGIEGAQHARDFYWQFPDQITSDRESFAELLSALVLFDRLIWDGSSCIQESADANEPYVNDEWVYTWFPVFASLRESRILTVFNDGVWAAPERLQRSREAAMLWVKRNVIDGQYKLPIEFRIPLTYSSPTYHDRTAFDDLNRSYHFTTDKLALAAFIHRGLFYQARTAQESAWSYLPHSYRGAVLADPMLSGLTLLCNEQILPTAHPLKGTDILREIGQRMSTAAVAATNVEPVKAGLAVGGAFIQRYPFSPIKAFEEAVAFRNSDQGIALRQWFSELVLIGSTANKPSITARLTELEHQLQTITLAAYGSASIAGRDDVYLVNLAGRWRPVIEAILHLLPIEWREICTRILNEPINATGMQVLFSYYLPGKRRMWQ